MKCVAILVMLATASVGVAVPSRAQEQDRRALLQQAVAEASAELAFRAADPALGPVGDSLWAASVLRLANELFFDLGRRADGPPSLWLRLAARHAPRAPGPDATHATEVQNAHEAAVERVEPDLERERGLHSTAWIWPEGLLSTDRGTLTVRGMYGDVPFLVAVAGQDAGEAQFTMEPGETRELQVGTYEMSVLRGDNPVRVTREILPGVETVVSLGVPPLMPAESASAIRRDLVSLLYRRGEATGCSNGVVWRPGVILTASSTIPEETDSIWAVLASDTVLVRFDEADDSLDVAILKANHVGPSAAAAVPAGQVFGWSAYRESCGASVQLAWTNVSEWMGGPLVVSRPRLPPGAIGAPLTDANGAVMGLVVGDGRVASYGDIEQSLDQILRAPFPFNRRGAWVVGSAVVVGAIWKCVQDCFDGAAGETGGIVINVPIGYP